jgi:hypothetical protein
VTWSVGLTLGTDHEHIISVFDIFLVENSESYPLFIDFCTYSIDTKDVQLSALWPSAVGLVLLNAFFKYRVLFNIVTEIC